MTATARCRDGVGVSGGLAEVLAQALRIWNDMPHLVRLAVVVVDLLAVGWR